MAPQNSPVSLPSAARRRFLAASAAAGLGGTLFPGALLTLAAQTPAPVPLGEASGPPAAAPFEKDSQGWPTITPAMIDAAAAIAAVKLTDAQKKMLLGDVVGSRNSALRVRELRLPNSVAPTAVFDPNPAGTPPPTPEQAAPVRFSAVPLAAVNVAQEDEIAFATVRQLGALLRSRQLTSVRLTELYLARLKRFDATLKFVITLTEDRALAQAAKADEELAAGHDRGPLHGIAWGAKDLLAVKGYPTTWGAAGFEDQHFDEDAEVVKRLDAAGAVLVAKLTLGALAMGDLWGYAAGTGKPGGRTRNPWNTRQGSSGSSAGSASAVAAGCVGFAIGTETLGSISSPSTRCGVTGLRPSFGRVPRTGAMALSWSMDKIGAIARSVEDAALVLNAIQGPDGVDQCTRPLSAPADFAGELSGLRVGYLKSAFDEAKFEPLPAEETRPLSAAEKTRRERVHRNEFAQGAYDARFATAALGTLRSMGVKLLACELPKFPFGSLLSILNAESAAAFDELTLSGRDALLSGQEPWDWPSQFRAARFIPALEYIQAERARALALKAMHDLFADFDVIVTPSNGTQLVATNLCGQPAVIVPNGMRGADAPPYAPEPEDDDSPEYGGPGTPVSLTFLAPLDGEAKACLLAHAYQRKTAFQLQRPKVS